jgi:hypothetical protein
MYSGGLLPVRLQIACTPSSARRSSDGLAARLEVLLDGGDGLGAMCRIGRGGQCGQQERGGHGGQQDVLGHVCLPLSA